MHGTEYVTKIYEDLNFSTENTSGGKKLYMQSALKASYKARSVQPNKVS